MYERICYSNGNPKTGRKLVELHKMCECSRCRNRYFPRKIRNAVTVTVEAENEDGTKNMEGISKAYDFIKQWKCEDASKDLPVQYVQF